MSRKVLLLMWHVFLVDEITLDIAGECFHMLQIIRGKRLHLPVSCAMNASMHNIDSKPGKFCLH